MHQCSVPFAASAVPYWVCTAVIEFALVTQRAFASLEPHAQPLAFALDRRLCKPLNFRFSFRFALLSLAFVVRARPGALRIAFAAKGVHPRHCCCLR